jgi:hypothetical protein
VDVGTHSAGMEPTGSWYWGPVESNRNILIPPINESVVVLRVISGAAAGAWSVQGDVRSGY